MQINHENSELDKQINLRGRVRQRKRGLEKKNKPNSGWKDGDLPWDPNP